MPHAATAGPQAASAGPQAATAGLRAIIAIPARNEALRIGACLHALAAQRDPSGAPFDFRGLGVLVFANGCGDATAAVSRGLGPSLPFPVIVLEAELPPALAHAGGARREALAAAAALLAEDGDTVLTTDADARPLPGWLAANFAALAGGANAVAGRPVPDPAEFATMSPALRRREIRETQYAETLDALSAALDPDAHDPWPRHGWHSGASIAIQRSALLAVGGVPPLPCGEDRALFAALAARGARIRHETAARVLVSCRLDGRAAGGMAATLRQRAAMPEAPVDGRLEPALDAWRRGRARALLRALRQSGDPALAARLATMLGWRAGQAMQLAALPTLGAAQAALENAPALRRRPVAATDLRRQTAIAWLLVRAARRMPPRFIPAAAGSRADNDRNVSRPVSG